jgi:hypothetical protein
MGSSRNKFLIRRRGALRGRRNHPHFSKRCRTLPGLRPAAMASPMGIYLANRRMGFIHTSGLVIEPPPGRPSGAAEPSSFSQKDADAPGAAAPPLRRPCRGYSWNYRRLLIDGIFPEQVPEPPPGRPSGAAEPPSFLKKMQTIPGQENDWEKFLDLHGAFSRHAGQLP